MTFGRITFDQADRIFSLFIRYRDGWECQRCGHSYAPEISGMSLQNSHFWGRGNENTRFDPENCDALCAGCHQLFTANPEDHRAWKLKRIGQERFTALMIRKNTYCKKDRVMSLIIAKQLLKQVCPGHPLAAK